MRTTVVMNQKGGVAKTTTVINMAAILAEDYEQSVLVIDADSQGNTTEFFGGALLGKPTLADLLRGESVTAADAVCPTNVPGVYMVPADDSLMDLDLGSIRGKTADMTCLEQLLRQTSGYYSYALVDCPPCYNAASAAALLAADDVIIPIKLDAFSLRGMANLTHQIHGMQTINPVLQVAGLLPTMTYNSAEITKALEILQASDLRIFPRIRRTAKVDDMTFVGAPLIKSSPKSAACVDYRRFVRAYVEGGADIG